MLPELPPPILIEDARGFQRLRYPLREILPMRGGNLEVLRQFAGILRPPGEFALKTGIGNPRSSVKSPRPKK